jgi:hypothetical protein
MESLMSPHIEGRRSRVRITNKRPTGPSPSDEIALVCRAWSEMRTPHSGHGGIAAREDRQLEADTIPETILVPSYRVLKRYDVVCRPG